MVRREEYKKEKVMEPEKNMADSTEPTKAEKAVHDHRNDVDVTPVNLGQDEVDLKAHFPDDVVGEEAVKQKAALTSAEKLAEFRERKIAELRKLYNSFEVKDMSFENFVKEFMDLTDQTKINNDVARIVEQKQMGLRNKSVIDSVMANMN